MTVIDHHLKMRLKFNLYASRTAFKRLRKSIEENNGHEIYSAVGELLLWVLTTEKWHKKHNKEYKKMKKSDENGIILFGLIHAYNSMKHNMEFFEIYNKQGGFTFPIQFPLEIKEINIRWMNAKNILEEGCEDQIKNYKKYIEGEDVLKTFDQALRFLNKVSEEFILR